MSIRTSALPDLRGAAKKISASRAGTPSENMRHGMTPKEACLDALKRISRNFKDDQARLVQFDIDFYALRKDGMYCGASLWNHAGGPGGQARKPLFTVNDGGESRHEECVWLYERA